MEEASAFGRSGYEEEEEMMTKPDTELNKVEFSTRHHLLHHHHNNKIENGRCLNDIQLCSSSLDQRNSRRLSSKTQQPEEEEVTVSARAELSEMKEENKRLKKCLDEVMRDYKTLQTQLINKRGHDKLKVAAAASTSLDITVTTDNDRETQLVSLSLGRSSSGVVSRFDSSKNDEKMKNKAGSSSSEEEEGGGLLRLGLECKLLETVSAGTNDASDQLLSPLPKPSPTASSCSGDEAKQEEELLVGGADADADDHDTLMPRSNKLGGSKTMRNNNNAAAAAVQVSNKRARVSVRSRCNTPTMNDGCQWRKYGQKIAKGNPCPRAYYRCTVAPSCPVRKQVQRCSQDMSILITTYEGTHNHPLSMSATAMASTTSAAAQMLLSGSSSSSSIPSSSLGPTRPVTDYLHGLNPNNYNYLDHEYSKPSTMMRSPPPFYFPTTAISSPSSSCPTITLDLTSSNHHQLITRFNPTSTLFPPPAALPSSTTSLSFNTINSSSDQNPSTTSSSLFSNWPLSSGTGIINNYAQLYGKTHQTSSSPYQQLPCNSSSSNGRNQQDTIAAATKAITADPNFQSALALALKSIINSGAGGSGDQGSGNHRAPQ